MSPADRVGKTTFSTPSDRELVATRMFDAPRRNVWEAHTNPQHPPRWMLGPEGWTMPRCEIDLRAGGKWRMQWRGPDGETMEMHGVNKEVRAPERLVYTENWGGDYPEAVDTLVFTEENGRTKLTTTVVYPSKEARDKAIATGMKEGWARSYDLLDAYLPRMMAGEAGASAQP